MGWSALALGAALALAAGASLAQDKADLVKARQDFMERQQHDFDAIGAFIKGKGDQATALEKANDLIALAPKIPDQFVPGTSSADFPGKSRAKPELFQNMDKVRAIVAILQGNERKLLAAVKSGDPKACRDQLIATFRDGCGTCHADYRAGES